MHLGIHIGHDPGVAAVDDNGVPQFIYEESKFNGFKFTLFHPVFSIINAAAKECKKYRSLTWVLPPEIDPLWRNAEGYYYVEILKKYLRSFLIETGITWHEEYHVMHHDAHAECAFFAAGFDKALTLAVDGSGEDASLILYTADKNRKNILEPIMTLPAEKFSFGEYYDVATCFLGYRKHAGLGHEGKIMGLSSYGKPKYLKNFQKFFYKSSNAVNPEARTMEQVPFFDSIGEAAALPRGGYTEYQADVAASAQKFLEDAMIRMLKHYSSDIKKYENLCLAGGVAMNSLMNGLLLRSGMFKDIFVFPAASDTGLCFGGAHYGSRMSKGHTGRKWEVAYKGSKTEKDAEVDLILKKYKFPVVKKTVNSKNFVADIAKRILDARIVAVCRGRLEIGARALGNRSILTLPDAKHRDMVNAKVKYREPWRPFAPIVTEEAAGEYFEFDRPEPFMTVIYGVKPKWKKKLDGITHVDGTARLQTVNRKQNPFLYDLLIEIGKHGLPPVLLNTSFNINGQPIVRTAYDALTTFMCTQIDDIVIENTILTKKEPDRIFERNLITALDRQLEPLTRNAEKIDIFMSDCSEGSRKAFVSFLNAPALAWRTKKMIGDLYIDFKNTSYLARWEFISQHNGLFNKIIDVSSKKIKAVKNPLMIFAGDKPLSEIFNGETGQERPSPAVFRHISKYLDLDNENIYLVNNIQQIVPGTYYKMVTTPFAEWSYQPVSVATKKNTFKTLVSAFAKVRSIVSKNKNLKVAVCGTGRHTELFLKYSQLNRLNITAFFDDSQAKVSNQLWGRPLSRLSSLKHKDFDFVLISSNLHQENIARKLKRSVPENKIIRFYNPSKLHEAANEAAVFMTLSDKEKNKIVGEK